MLGAICSIITIGLVVGLGVGLTQGGSSSDDYGSDLGSDNSTAFSNSTTQYGHCTNGCSFWKPANGTSWQIVLPYALNDTSPDVQVFDIDLFMNNASAVNSLHAENRKVICYFSAGSFENWRPDAGNFSTSDYGKPLDGWPGEWWLNTNLTSVRNIMLARLDLAVTKGCDGVDPDNVDAYDNDNGLGLTQIDAISYLDFLASAAHNRSLSIGLKNGGAILPHVIEKMQWSVNEQCVQYSECDLFRPFITAGKPVFHIEYPNSAPHVSTTQKNNVCNNTSAEGFSTLLKDMDLDDWYEACAIT